MTENEICTPGEALYKLIEGNKAYVEGVASPADLSHDRMVETAREGQAPYALVVTCSDSRVPPEHIFSAGIGDLFVVRTAGNVIGDFERGSIEYAVEQLGVTLVVVMGHSQCGAVGAALAGRASGYLDALVSEIAGGIAGAADEYEALCRNVAHSQQRIRQSATVSSLVEEGRLKIVGAHYDLQTGQVSFLPEG